MNKSEGILHLSFRASKRIRNKEIITIVRRGWDQFSIIFNQIENIFKFEVTYEKFSH